VAEWHLKEQHQSLGTHKPIMPAAEICMKGVPLTEEEESRFLLVKGRG